MHRRKNLHFRLSRVPHLVEPAEHRTHRPMPLRFAAEGRRRACGQGFDAPTLQARSRADAFLFEPLPTLEQRLVALFTD